MYVVGLTQVLIFDQPEVMQLTPMQLILSAAVVIAFLRPLTQSTAFSIFLIYVLGFGVEVLGVQTGFPFGSYSYGAILGPKIFETPLLIGLNWVLVIVGSLSLVRRILPGANTIIRTILSATIAVFLDVLIEPVAVALDMWTWTEGSIPKSNYFAWWVLAAIFTAIYQKWGNKSSSAVVITVFFWLVIFFGCLNIYYI